MSLKQLTILLTVSILIFSCTKPKPQLPSNKINATDSVSMALTHIYNSLIEKEDSILSKYVAENYPSFTKTKSGFWYFSNCKNANTTLKLHDKCSIRMKIYSLEGVLLLNENQTLHIGRKETITGIEETLKLISKGCSASVILPWYLAFGSKGKEPEIPPYTSVYAEIFVSD